jgi:hypothetical protein
VPARETHSVHPTASGAKRCHSIASRIISPLTFGLLAGLIFGQTTSAFAASDWRDYYAPRRAMARASEKKAAEHPIPTPLFAVISIADQRVAFYGSDGVVAQAPVSTGMRGHPTPTGVFAIVQKKRWHESNIYSSAPMPFMQRITWSGIAMHAGVLPGYPASHGCIRMPSGFAQRIFRATKIGQRVVIAPHTVKPNDIAHKNLPVPILTAAEQPAEARAVPAQPTATIAENERKQGTGTTDAVSLTAAPAEAKRLNPEEYAQQLKREANEKAKAAAKETKAAQLLNITKTTEARLAVRKLASAQAALKNANDKLTAANRKAEKADGDEAVAKATEAKTAAEAAVAEAQKTRDEASSLNTTRQEELAAARRAAEDAKTASRAAVAALAEANRRLKPLSVFISKKTGRLYVRQDFQRVFDAPVTISEPERPIGTHLYVTTRAAEDGASLTWVSLSMPPEAQEPKRTSREGKSSRAKEETPPVPEAATLPPETAAGALGRITIPDDTAKRVGELLWVGASIIVSDHGISGETGDTTDFIILTRSRTSAQ